MENLPKALLLVNMYVYISNGISLKVNNFIFNSLISSIKRQNWFIILVLDNKYH